MTLGKFADWPSRHGVVYFIGAGRPAIAIKIGLTQASTIERRLRSIQSSNHEPLELLGLIGPKLMSEVEKDERDLHTQFAQHQLVVDGNVGHEWFRVTDDLLAYIKQHAAPPEQFGLHRSVAKIAM